MAARSSYSDFLKADLGAMIDALGLADLQKHMVRARWLDQVLWMERRANAARDRYYALRLTTIVGGVILPALVSLNVSDTATARPIVRWIAFGLSLLVALTAAVEEFFHYGERWRHYRRTVEWLKSEGWEFFQLGGPYRRYKTHGEAYQAFAGRVEEIIQRDIDQYVTKVVQEQTEEKKDKGQQAATKPTEGSP